MKKFLCLFALFNLLFIEISSAGVTVDEDPIVEGQKGNTNGPKGVLPSVTLTSSGDNLYINIGGFTGVSSVRIVSEEGNLMAGYTSLNTPVSLSFDCSAFPVGRYFVYIKLGNSLNYIWGIDIC